MMPACGRNVRLIRGRMSARETSGKRSLNIKYNMHELMKPNMPLVCCQWKINATDMLALSNNVKLHKIKSTKPFSEKNWLPQVGFEPTGVPY